MFSAFMLAFENLQVVITQPWNNALRKCMLRKKKCNQTCRAEIARLLKEIEKGFVCEQQVNKSIFETRDNHHFE